jgi:hypothetical protein
MQYIVLKNDYFFKYLLSYIKSDIYININIFNRKMKQLKILFLRVQNPLLPFAGSPQGGEKLRVLTQ